jgi:hypothetical protein
MSKQFPNVGKFPHRLDNISTRLMYIITEETSENGRFGWLENATGIGRKTWQAWFSRSSMPSGNMLEAAGRLWPQYAFWLVTGMTDEDYGHTRPIRSKSLEPRKSTARMRFKEYFEFFAHMQYVMYGDTNETETEKEKTKKTDVDEFELHKRKTLRRDEMRLLDAFEEKEITRTFNEMTSKNEPR